MTQDSLTVRAGTRAIERIRDEGLDLNAVKVLAGASGAAKFLVLTGIDRVLIELLANRQQPLHLIGTSIGAFRMAAFCHPDPRKALDNLEHEYIEQHYSRKPTKQEVSLQSNKILDCFIADQDLSAIINNPSKHLNFLANRCKGLLKSENTPLQLLGLGLAAAGNYLRRDYLRYFMDRAHFTSRLNETPFDNLDEFPISHHQLTENNFKQALLACGSIPIVMAGISSIEGAPGMYRDGGLLDYHLDFSMLPAGDDGLVLYPHFYDHMIPGWFDKSLKRYAKPINTENVVLVSPSKSFTDTLPFQKIPDRVDFKTFHDDKAERVNYWRKTVKQSQALGETFADWVESGRIRNKVKAL